MAVVSVPLQNNGLIKAAFETSTKEAKYFKAKKSCRRKVTNFF